jgi:hypothetical protein
MGERAEGIAASGGLNSCQAHHVGVSPQEDRSGAKVAMGEDKGSEQEIDPFRSLGSLLRRVRSRLLCLGQALNSLCCQFTRIVISPNPWRLFATVDLG